MNSLPEKNRPYEVGLEYFTKNNAPEVVSYCKDASRKLNSNQIIFKEKGSNVVLACAFTHICNSVRHGKHGQLETDISLLLKRQPLELSRTPEQFDAYIHPETMAGTILAGLSRVEKTARAYKYLPGPIQLELSSILNTCPFFRFCLIYWVRLQALALLAE